MHLPNSNSLIFFTWNNKALQRESYFVSLSPNTAAKYYDVDGISDPIGFPDQPEAPSLPSPHEISAKFFEHQKTPESSNIHGYSHMLMLWGQFVDHDMTLTAESEGGDHCLFPRSVHGLFHQAQAHF